ncbi:hypothetical protein [Paracoccus methylarcula]|uniref:Uncharacterized protein n=1 Tax=Paracoccus methylarcula TaxID=72022 RepID=A0A422QZ51_9RHOB|nr:hypothetical protein [Paracoccus methylarcula]RNF35264.1 hypothetical protein A7A09_006535 [Paracoccus methylarcula]
MRFLLTFHSGAAGQWRCLDTALLPAFRSGRAEDLPSALHAAPDLVMRWLLGRYEIANVMVPAAGNRSRAPGPDGPIAVYALDPGRSVIGLEQEYHGAWLEMFLQQNRPLGFIAARKAQAVSAMEALASLEERAARPLNAADPACRETTGRMADQQRILDKLRNGGADGATAMEEEA